MNLYITSLAILIPFLPFYASDVKNAMYILFYLILSNFSFYSNGKNKLFLKATPTPRPKIHNFCFSRRKFCIYTLGPLTKRIK